MKKMRTKHSYFLGLFLLGFFCSCGQKHNLVVEIDGWGNDSIYLSVAILDGYDEDDDAKFIDSILIAKDGKITFDTQEPVLIYLVDRRAHV